MDKGMDLRALANMDQGWAHAIDWYGRQMESMEGIHEAEQIGEQLCQNPPVVLVMNMAAHPEFASLIATMARLCLLEIKYRYFQQEGKDADEEESTAEPECQDGGRGPNLGADQEGIRPGDGDVPGDGPTSD